LDLVVGRALPGHRRSVVWHSPKNAAFVVLR